LKLFGVKNKVMELKSRIIQLVNEHGPIKPIDLIIHLSEILYEEEESFIEKDILQSIDEVIKDQSIIEIKYILPTIQYKERSMLFPVNTIFI